MFDDRTLKKWLALEGHRVNEALVTSAKPIDDVLEEGIEELPTKGGGALALDLQAVAAVAEALSPYVRSRVKIPITFYVSHKDAQDCYVSDEHAIRALEQLELVNTEPREGKLWLSRPLAYQIAKDHPTVFQFCRV